jgi:hypothetical protein
VENLIPANKIMQDKYLLASLFLIFFLFSMVVTIRSQEVITQNGAADSHNTENPLTLTVINEYFEIIAVFLEAGVVLLLWKTVKDFAELAKVSKLQTEVRFRPSLGPSGGFELLREDHGKKQYSIAMKNLSSSVECNCHVYHNRHKARQINRY